MSLIFEIEFLTGVCRAARQLEDHPQPDWPPQADRVFSALVSAWAARGEQAGEREALEWLEKQTPPMIYASDCFYRSTPKVYVPPNDSKTPKTVKPPSDLKTAKKYLEVMPELRRRQERHFPVIRPDDSVVKFLWQNNPGTGVLRMLDALARDIGYIGHSTSLTRCRFMIDEATSLRHTGRSSHHRVYKGRLKELEDAHNANSVRPVISPGTSVFLEATSDSFSTDDWLILEVIDGEVPDIRASALVCRLLRLVLMSGYRKIGRGDDVPEVVSGHSLDGSPSRLPHLAIVPMVFAGFPYADGRVLGFALIPPRGVALKEVDGFRVAFEQAAPYCQDRGRRVLTLRGNPLKGDFLSLSPAHENIKAQKWSLSPSPYQKPAHLWASVTPIVLERYLKRGNDFEVRELIVRACEYAGLPRPNLDKIQVGKHSAVEGVPPARPLYKEPPWMRWKAPNTIENRPFVHAVIDFEQEISGPVLLGAGRFTGLGLCRRLGN